MVYLKYVPSLPRGRVDLLCRNCHTRYEFNNWRRYGDDTERAPSCPVCGCTSYQRVYIAMPHIRMNGWTPPEDPHAKLVTKTGSGQFTDDEYRAMAISHALNTNEWVDWRDVKKDIETKYYSAAPVQKSDTGGDTS